MPVKMSGSGGSREAMERMGRIKGVFWAVGRVWFWRLASKFSPFPSLFPSDAVRFAS